MHTNNGFLFSTNPPSLQGLGVLVVDGNVDLGDLLTPLLQPYGVEVQAASSAQQGLEIFMQWQPDVLVSEIALPHEDGYSLIHQLRTNAGDRGKVVLAIAVTDYANEKMLQRALRVGFDLWFTKPLDFDEFIPVLSCLAICQQSSYTIAQRILGNVRKHKELSLEKQLYQTSPTHRSTSKRSVTHRMTRYCHQR